MLCCCVKEDSVRTSWVCSSPAAEASPHGSPGQELPLHPELDLNKKNGGGWTPLMYASYIGHDTIVHLLLEAGVSVNVPTPEGQTPLMLASSCGNESIAYFLLQVSYEGTQVQKPEGLPGLPDRREALQAVVCVCARVITCDSCSMAAWRAPAPHRGDEAQGAELEMKDIQGWTALFHCTSAGHQHMVRFLLDSGANANVREPIYGFTPLMEAAAAGHEIIVQILGQNMHVVHMQTRRWVHRRPAPPSCLHLHGDFPTGISEYTYTHSWSCPMHSCSHLM
ncbi:hypothetical protein P7K49_022922 [Saguinus oedipus]|uniref:Ankyrin repeat and sterile alpha motif domain containing 3 n=1 Tax=Saguinus oedipus TaxID=9490 RepID=A0ABQ9UK63_SAGOE|nr:hypothetical protein P7K49_022922 [Saguinus oedipus]